MYYLFMTSLSTVPERSTSEQQLRLLTSPHTVLSSTGWLQVECEGC